ncbi:hypothetical protein LZ31DRAFT_171757 [Colletotrichum somersetense]|nr:hypothetical protein LZ31DRAFT_171757 [Colletotrichum somersetense]
MRLKKASRLSATGNLIFISTGYSDQLLLTLPVSRTSPKPTIAHVWFHKLRYLKIGHVYLTGALLLLFNIGLDIIDPSRYSILLCIIFNNVIAHLFSKRPIRLVAATKRRVYRI